MEKLLTVSIAAYNVEAFLSQALDSCIISDNQKALEVLIVNDGSKDSTPQIAKEYCEKYPTVFRLLNKENGGYGSTVNLSMQEAKGKYFRLLDGDDWFNPGGLTELLKVLQHTDADLVVTPCYRIHEGTGEQVLSCGAWEACLGKTLSMEELPHNFILGMWYMTVRTALLREHPFALPEHKLYTDQLFVVYSMAYTKKLVFLTEPLYCYRIGRDGQSVSRDSRIRNRHQAADVVDTMVHFYLNQTDIPSANRKLLKVRIGSYLGWAVNSILLGRPSLLRFLEVVTLLRKFKTSAPDLYLAAMEKSSRIRRMNRTHGLVYWKLAGRIENTY